ncbi:MAG: alpha/beta hydrolase [Akkermansiaceae bacterium]
MIGEARDQQLLGSATTYCYAKIPEGDLNAHFFFPPGFNHKTDRLAVILFLHGGMWDISAPSQFIPHCHHFASRGIIAVTAEYRTQVKFNGGPEEAAADIKTIISFLRYHADHMGIDPNKIIVCGAAAGAHGALCATLHPHEDTAIPSPKPQGLVLFGPVSDTSPRGGIGHELYSSPKAAKSQSPLNHLPQKDLPPCLIFHGEMDRMVPLNQSIKFTKKYSKKRNKCDLIDFRGAGHTFFNFNSDERNYKITLRSMDYFLVDLEILDPDPLAGEFD